MTLSLISQVACLCILEVDTIKLTTYLCAVVHQQARLEAYLPIVSAADGLHPHRKLTGWLWHHLATNVALKAKDSQ